MDDSTTTGQEVDDLLEDNDGDSDVLAKVRAKARKEAAARKEAEARLTELLTAQTQQRLAQIDAVVNDSAIPKAAVDALKAQVEDMDADQFASVLTDLRGSAPEGEAPTEEASATSAPPVNPADLGQQVAAAAAGKIEVDPLQKINSAQSREELAAAAAELGLDSI